MENFGSREEDIKAVISILRESDFDDNLFSDDDELAKQIADVSIMTAEWGNSWLVWEEFMGEQRVVELRLKDVYCDLYGEPLNLPALRILEFTFSDLLDLDLSLCPLLEELDCSNNKIELSLDLENNKRLRKLDCSANCLEELYVSDSSELTHLDCSDNWLNNLDLSNNTKLEELNYDDNDDLEEVILPEHLKEK